MADLQPLVDLYVLDLFGTAVFAVSGCLAAARRRMDVFGAVVLGTVTALGGGTIRDVLLGVRPVFWIAQPVYLWVVLAASLVTFVGLRVGRVPRRALMLSDAVGLSVFTIIGCAVAIPLVESALVVVLMGMVTGVAGGITRDLLAAEVPLIFRREVYATASLAGGLLYLLALQFKFASIVAVTVGVAATLLIRLAAIRGGLMLPRFGSDRSDDPSLPF